MEIVRAGVGDVERVLAAPGLFDREPTAELTRRFLGSAGHHLLLAIGDDGVPVGFISGVETSHPDKGTEMFLYELSVAPEHRNRGIGSTLVEALSELARELGCYGMWVGTEADNAAALAVYLSAGAAAPEPFLSLTWTF